MSAAPRDLLKTRATRLGEVYTLMHLGVGQANGQLVSQGCGLVVGTPNTTIGINAGAIIMGGAETQIAAVVTAALPAGAATSASQFLKVLVETDATGALYLTAGAPVTTQQSDAVLPKGLPTRISLGWVEVPPSFVVGTTVVTAAMLKNMAYWGAASILSGI